MALGNYNNNDKKNNYDPTVYCPFKFTNPNSEIDATALSFHYWNNALVLTITPKKENSNAEYTEWDKENAIKITLTHRKARMLHDEIINYLDNKVNANHGVPSGSGLVYISDGKEFGKNGLCLVIRKINPDTGAMEASIAYQFRADVHYAIRNYSEAGNQHDKIYYDRVEVDELLTILKSYYESITGAVAYSVLSNMKYDTSRMNTKIGLMMEKLGIESKGGYNKPSGSVFNNTEPRNYSNPDDLDSMMGE